MSNESGSRYPGALWLSVSYRFIMSRVVWLLFIIVLLVGPAVSALMSSVSIVYSVSDVSCIPSWLLKLAFVFQVPMWLPLYV